MKNPSFMRTASQTRRFGFLACATVVLVMSVVGVGASGTPSWSPTDVRVSDDSELFPGPFRSVREPSVAIDPASPDRMLAVAMDMSTLNLDPNQYGTNRTYRSIDGGQTWSDLGPVKYTDDPGEVATYSRDPVVTFGQDGTAFLASLATFPDERTDGIYVHRSHDAGATWELPSLAVAETIDTENNICTGTDKEWLSTDPTTGRLYLAYTLLTQACSSLDDPFGLAAIAGISDISIFLTTSDDAGQTWSEPHRVWSGYALGAMPRVTPDGTILIAFWSTVELPQGPCATAIGALPARAGGDAFAAIVIARSTDGGQTWAHHLEGTCGTEPELLKPGSFIGGAILPAISVDPTTGTSFVAWPAYSVLTQRFAIKVVTSADEGATWSAPTEITVGDDHAMMPAVFADGGEAHIAFLSVTPDPAQLVLGPAGATGDTYVVRTSDAATWSEPLKLSSEPADYSAYADVGDYIGIDAAGGRIVAMWADARAGDRTEIWARVGSVVDSFDARYWSWRGSVQPERRGSSAP